MSACGRSKVKQWLSANLRESLGIEQADVDSLWWMFEHRVILPVMLVTGDGWHYLGDKNFPNGFSVQLEWRPVDTITDEDQGKPFRFSLLQYKFEGNKFVPLRRMRSETLDIKKFIWFAAERMLTREYDPENPEPTVSIEMFDGVCKLLPDYERRKEIEDARLVKIATNFDKIMLQAHGANGYFYRLRRSLSEL